MCRSSRATARSKGSSTAWRSPLRFPAGDAEALAQRLLEIGAAGPRVRHELGAELRRRVAAGHSIDSWADAVVATISGLRRE